MKSWPTSYKTTVHLITLDKTTGRRSQASLREDPPMTEASDKTRPPQLRIDRPGWDHSGIPGRSGDPERVMS
jgi:hypothetical protein